MKVAVVLPGIMGTRLHLPRPDGSPGDEIWPPTPREAVFGYHKIAELQRPDLVVGQIIDNILCYNFYNLLEGHLRAMRFRRGSSTRRIEDFGYDWRQDNFDTAERLAERLDQLHADGAEEIYLLAHSMGGLAARLMLEDGRFGGRPWFGSIKLLATFGTPHLGAPLALARIFGLDAANGVSAKDFAKLAANRDYPSGYQLIPAPGDAAVWNVSGSEIVPMDPYTPADAAALGMDDVLVSRARALHEVLARENRPNHVRYAFFGGTGHKTATRVNVFHPGGGAVDHKRSVVTHTDRVGDGTVPLYCAVPCKGLRQVVINEHATVFKGTPFRKVLFRLFGQDAGSPLEAMPLSGLPDTLHLQLSTDAQVYQPGQPIELVLTVVDPVDDIGRAPSIEGVLRLQMVDEAQNDMGAQREIPVTAIGGEVSSLTLYLADIQEAGLYLLSFSGDPAAAADIAFAVQREQPG